MPLSLETLPTELIAHIFAFVTKASDRKNSALVCRKFHQILREHFKRSNVLLLTSNDPDAAPISVFKDQDYFPFSKVRYEYDSSEGFRKADDFWRKRGSNIIDLTLICKSISLNPVVQELNTYFPELKRLTISGYECIMRPTLIVYETFVEELDLMDADFLSQVVEHFVRCCPCLRRLHLSSQIVGYDAQAFPKYLNHWAEKVEEVEFSAHYFSSQTSQVLKPLLNVPSEKFLFNYFHISAKNEKLETLKSFFAVPRRIVQMVLHDSTFLSREKFLVIANKAEVRELHLQNGIPEFENSLESLAALKGLEKIELLGTEAFCRRPIPASVAAKIRAVYWEQEIDVDLLVGAIPNLRNLEQLRFGRGLTNDLIQVVIQNCPKLRELSISGEDLTDDGFTGGDREGWRPISTLENLENFFLGPSDGITDESFQRGFKFSKMVNLNITDVEQLTIEGIKGLIENCPNLELLYLVGCPRIDEACLQLICEGFFYLDSIFLSRCGISETILEQTRTMYPHLKITYPELMEIN